MNEILERIQKLEAGSFNYVKDHIEITKLYQEILEVCSDKQNFIANSANTMKLLSENNLNDNEQKKWLSFAIEVYACYLAVKIYEEKNIGSLDELNQAEHFFRNERLQNEIASIGLYSCAQILNIADPMRCYELTKEAFIINPSIGKFLNIKYEYHSDESDSNITKACPICGKKSATPYYCSNQALKLDQKSMFPPAKLWMKCNDCSNYYTYEFPLSQTGEINGKYIKNGNSGILENRFPLHVYNDLFKQLKALSSGKEYLEIGVGNGEMLAVAQEFGYHVDAVEICKEDCEKISSALNIDIEWCDIEKFEAKKQYDVIVMGDVFEHVTKPVEVLRKVRDMLKQEGVLWLSTPNYNCAYARMQKFDHCMWHELNHYTYVSFETMKELLHGLGMEVVDYNISKRYIGSMELFIKN